MLLAVETSSRSASVAIGPRGGAFELHTLPPGRSETLAELVARVLPEGGRALQGYALGVGPGSFTGLRVGLCFLKGFALVFPRPVVPISSFRVVAEQVLGAEVGASSVLVVLDARNGEALAGRYLRGPEGAISDPTLPDALYSVSELSQRARDPVTGAGLVAGEGASSIGDDLPRAPPALWVPQADTLARLAAHELEAGRGRDILELEPSYHQKPTALRRLEAARGLD